MSSDSKTLKEICFRRIPYENSTPREALRSLGPPCWNSCPNPPPHPPNFEKSLQLSSRKRCDCKNAATLRFTIACTIKLAAIFVFDNLGILDLSLLRLKKRTLWFGICRFRNAAIYDFIQRFILISICGTWRFYNLRFENASICNCEFWEAKPSKSFASRKSGCKSVSSKTSRNCDWRIGPLSRLSTLVRGQRFHRARNLENSK